MKRHLLILLLILLVPASVFAASTKIAPASFSAAQTLVAASSSPGNAYAAGASIILTAPVSGDFLACGGSIVTAAPVASDEFLVAGSISSRANVAGDLRTIGGSISIDEPVGGDLIALGYSVHDSGRVGGNAFVVAANAELKNGAVGAVSIYGNNVVLAGDFASDVTVVAWGHLTLAPGTTIHGKLSYESPEAATIPASSTIVGGITYTNATYLPDVGTSHLLVFISVGFFLIARIFGAIILAGLLAGLFPKFAEAVTERVLTTRLRGTLLSLLLGFAVVVATPIVVALLMLTFVGMGLALLLFIVYILLILLAFLYAGIVTGAVLVRRFTKRRHLLWHDGAIGMMLLSLITLVPFVGMGVVFLASLLSAGTLLQIFFHFAFAHEDYTSELL